MATFPSIQPTYGMRKTSAPRIRSTRLGDGYEFRALFGLPLTQDPKIYDLTFNVSETQSDVIEGFLRSRVNDQASFTFTPPGEGFTKTGTYNKSGTTVTITITNHGLAIVPHHLPRRPYQRRTTFSTCAVCSKPRWSTQRPNVSEDVSGGDVIHGLIPSATR